MKKFLITLIIISLLSFSSPQKIYAQYVDIPNALKEYGLDSLAYVISKTVTRKLTAKTVNWINSGFKGNPGYIQNPDQFFLDVGDDLASQFLSQAGINKLCTPFQPQVRIALLKNYISDDSQNYSCTLSILKNNYDSFTSDFTQGGWEGWFEITQNSQNNPFGAYLAAQNELAIQVSAGQQQKQKELDLSGGFLNLKRCPKGQETIIGAQTYCKVKEETVTPGSIISDQLQETLGSKWGQLVEADEFNEIITALVSQLIEQVAGASGGLFGASEKVTKPSGGIEPSLVDQIAAETQPSVNHRIGATAGGINCNATGGGGGDGSYDSDGDGIPDGGGSGGTGGSVRCTSTPPSVTGLPPWPLGQGGSGGASCSPYTPNPSVDCTRVDGGAVLSILNNYPPSNNGLRAAISQVQALYPQAEIMDHPIRLDKIDFGNGMHVDVIGSAVGNANGSEDDEGTGWGWDVECACNRNPDGSPATNPPTPIPGVGTYLLTVEVNGLGSVTDYVDTCENLSGIATTTCSKPFPKDSYVSITAIPAVGKSFMGWTGACSVFGLGTTCYGNITANGTVGAIFR